MLIDISKKQYAQLQKIRQSVRPSTGKDLSFKQALEIYATKQPKSRISIVTQRRKNAPLLIGFNDVPLAEIKIDPSFRKLLSG